MGRNRRKQSGIEKGDRVIALVNNLGAVPLSELYAVYDALEKECQTFGLSIERSLVDHIAPRWTCKVSLSHY